MSTEPSPDRNVSPLGDRREHPVACWRCQRPTWAVSAECEDCADRVPVKAGDRG